MSHAKSKRQRQDVDSPVPVPQSQDNNSTSLTLVDATGTPRRKLKATLPNVTASGDKNMNMNSNNMNMGGRGYSYPYSGVVQRKTTRQQCYHREIMTLNYNFREWARQMESTISHDVESSSYDERKEELDEKHTKEILFANRQYIKYAREVEEKYNPPIGYTLTFGNGDCGQLALTENNMSVSVPKSVVGLRNQGVASMALGGLHTVIAMATGKVETWGCNDEGSLGDYTKDTAFAPVAVHGFIPSSKEVCTDLEKVTAWDDLSPDVLQMAKDPKYEVDKEFEETIVEVAAGDCQSLALSTTGRVYMFGAYKDKEGTAWRDCMPPDDPRKVHPVEKWKNLVPPCGSQDWPIHCYQLPGKALQIRCGASFNVAILEKKDGEKECYTWGLGECGELARPVFQPLKKPYEDREKDKPKKEEKPKDSKDKKEEDDNEPDPALTYLNFHVDKARDEYILPRPVLWADTSILTNRNVVSIGCGSFHLMVIAQDGQNGELKVFSSGLNNYGQLGLGDENPREKLTKIDALDGRNIVQIEGGVHHSLALDSSGCNLYAWGRACSGQLGNATVQPEPGACVSEPISVSLNDGEENPVITAISCGGNHNLVLTEDGEAYSWGFGDLGALGHGDEEDELKPRKLDALKNVNKKKRENNEPQLKATIHKVAGGGQHSAITLTQVQE